MEVGGGVGGRVDGGWRGDHHPVEDLFFPVCHGWIEGRHGERDEVLVHCGRTVGGSSVEQVSQ